MLTVTGTAKSKESQRYAVEIRLSVIWKTSRWWEGFKRWFCQASATLTQVMRYLMLEYHGKLEATHRLPVCQDALNHGPCAFSPPFTRFHYLISHIGRNNCQQCPNLTLGRLTFRLRLIVSITWRIGFEKVFTAPLLTSWLSPAVRSRSVAKSLLHFWTVMALAGLLRWRKNHPVKVTPHLFEIH